MDKELALLKKRFLELARKAYDRNLYTYTDFLGLAQQNVLHEVEREVRYAGLTFSGTGQLPDGGEAERVMARFGNAENCGYEEAFPIAAISIKPLQKKFAQELTHRDFLGALMNLGIERSRLGDLWVQDKEAILFCHTSVEEIVLSELTRVRHTEVICKRVDDVERLGNEQNKPVEELLQVSAERIDACIAKLYHLSRSDSLELFRQGKVYVDGRLCENNSYLLKPDETISVRGYGRFVFQGVTGQTKKGKLSIRIAVFGRK